MHDVVHNALRGFPEPWLLLSGYRMERLRLTVDAVLVSDRAVLVFAADKAKAEAAALDLADFHLGCRNLPVLPVALLKAQFVTAQDPLPLPGAAPPVACTRLLLPGLLARVAAFPPRPGFDPRSWPAAPYRPVPALMQAACDLYARHDVASLSLASSASGALARTRDTVAAIAATARTDGRKQVVFVTGPPGAGKTLCGLDLAFTPATQAAFLTGNPALLHVLRAALVRDGRQAGLVASAGGRRLRAEGLGGLLWHQDEDAVARWFLDRWPDIRSAEALEVAATEFGIQGLELDQVGLCWDADLVRSPDGSAWNGRAFRATTWSRPLAGEALSNKLNAYRVLLTRARRRTLVWIPRGDPRDPTRDPARYDAVAAFLQRCGLQPLDAGSAPSQHAPMPEPALL